jgi:hypothetical protein
MVCDLMFGSYEPTGEQSPFPGKKAKSQEDYRTCSKLPATLSESHSGSKFPKVAMFPSKQIPFSEEQLAFQSSLQILQ